MAIDCNQFILDELLPKSDLTPDPDSAEKSVLDFIEKVKEILLFVLIKVIFIENAVSFLALKSFKFHG